MFKEKMNQTCLMFKNTKTLKKIGISYTLIPFILISLIFQFFIKAVLMIIGYFSKEKEKKKTEKWYKIIFKYLVVPIFFGTISPIKETEDKEYVFNIKCDERKATHVDSYDIIIYWISIFVINFIVILCLFFLFQNIPRPYQVAFCIFVVVHQLGYGIRWKVLLEEEKMIIFLKSLFIFLGFIILFLTIVPKDNNNKIIYIKYLNEMAIFHLFLGLMTLFINIVLSMIVKSIKDFQQAKLQKKWQLIIGDSFLISISVLVIIVLVRSLVFNLNFESFNITVGYSTYLTLLLGSVTVIGVFLNILSDMFLGKTLLYFVSNVSRNIFMLVGVRCFISSLILIFLWGPYYIVYKSYKYLDVISVQYILILAIFLLIIATGLLLTYLYQVVYAVKNYSENVGSEFNNMTKWFAFVLVENIAKSDLQLDIHAQNNLIERLIDLKVITYSEIVKIFNSNLKFENQNSENTVVLAILKYFNKESIPKYTEIKEKLSKLRYINEEMKTELEKLQKKYGILPSTTDEVGLKIEEIEKSLNHKNNYYL